MRNMNFSSFIHAACLLSLALLTPPAWAQEKEAAAPKFTITTEASPTNAGTVTGGGTKATNASFALTAHPNAGYSFLNWSLDGAIVSANSPYVFTPANNETLVAN